MKRQRYHHLLPSSFTTHGLYGAEHFHHVFEHQGTSWIFQNEMSGHSHTYADQQRRPITEFLNQELNPSPNQVVQNTPIEWTVEHCLILWQTPLWYQNILDPVLQTILFPRRLAVAVTEPWGTKQERRDVPKFTATHVEQTVARIITKPMPACKHKATQSLGKVLEMQGADEGGSNRWFLWDFEGCTLHMACALPPQNPFGQVHRLVESCWKNKQTESKHRWGTWTLFPRWYRTAASCQSDVFDGCSSFCFSEPSCWYQS